MPKYRAGQTVRSVSGSTHSASSLLFCPDSGGRGCWYDVRVCTAGGWSSAHQLRMALLLRLRRSLRRAGASVHGLKDRAAAVACSAHSVVGAVRRRVHKAWWSRAGWLVASMKLLRRGSGRIADLVSRLRACRVVRSAIRLVQRLADSRVTAGLMRGADAARSVLVVRLGILALKGLGARARKLVTGLVVVASALLVRLTRFRTATAFSVSGDALSWQEELATDCETAKPTPAEGRLTGEEVTGIYEAMLTLEAALPETNVLLDGAEHTWVPEATVLAEEVLRRCTDECLHLRELAQELQPAEGAAAAG